MVQQALVNAKTSAVITPIAAVGAGIGGGGFATSGNDFTTGTYDARGANFVIMSVTWFPAGCAGTTGPAVTDSNSNLYIKGTTTYVNASATEASALFWNSSATPIVTINQTWTVTCGGGGYPGAVIQPFSGVLASPLDQSSGASNFTTGTTFQPGVITPTTGNQLIVVGAGINNTATTVTISGGTNDSGFTTIFRDTTPGSGFGTALGYVIQTAALAVNPKLNFGASQSSCGPIASFQ